MAFDLTTNILYPGAVTHVLQYVFAGKVVELVEQVTDDDYVTARFAPMSVVDSIECQEYHFGLFVRLTFENGTEINFSAVEAIDVVSADDNEVTVSVVAMGAEYQLILTEIE